MNLIHAVMVAMAPTFSKTNTHRIPGACCIRSDVSIETHKPPIKDTDGLQAVCLHIV